MELGAATSGSYNGNCLPDSNDCVTQQRLNELIRLNAEKDREKALYRSDDERLQAALMSRPIPSQKVFGYFGLMIGSMPPAAVILKVFNEATLTSPGEALFLGLFALSGIMTGFVGYASGKHIPSMIERVASLRMPNNVFALSAVGFGWGAISGGVGGVFLFLVGSIFGALIGGAIGAVALPILAAFHSLLRSGDVMELKHFLPIAFGITLSFCALILGL